jgi:hypothetical protein
MQEAWRIVGEYVSGDLTYAEAQERLRFVEAPGEMFQSVGE